MKCYFGKNVVSSEKASDQYLTINNCGYFLDIDEDIKDFREHGRIDYQLIYISKGNGEFVINSKKINVESGNIILFFPNVKQDYSFKGGNCTSYYWIHFTGLGVDQLLQAFHINREITKIGDMPEFSDICSKMVIEYQIERENINAYTRALFIELLAKISQRINMPFERNNPVSNALLEMNHSYKDNLTIDDYAKMCEMSKFHFIRVFKENMGLTPHLYKTKILIEKSKNLLITTNLSVNYVANALGYEDAFYFSRAFKKATGISPSKFRKISK